MRWSTFCGPNKPWTIPIHRRSGPCIRERQIAEHKAEIVQYKTYLQDENYLRRMIVNSVGHEWIAEVESKTMEFNHRSPIQLLYHLHQVGGSLDHMDITELISNLQKLEALVIPGMQQKTLMSVGTLANNGYTTVFLPG
ncbi:hypothetical protein ACHAW6_006799 [Cyclotella cf. meneghiniana]